jgi:CRISPR/Cas system CSM-associated protein Csm4 (group 5 of RAMP superfamily)
VVAGRRILGYSVRVAELTLDESLILQERGLGGKRRMGCGVFRGTRGVQ